MGLVGNRQHQRSHIIGGAYDLAFVEFDDQGRCYDRRQMAAVASWISQHIDEDAIIVVFVHGWKHDARSDDDNLAHFRDVLSKVVQQEATEHQRSGGSHRPVLGVFVGWRGMSIYDRFGAIDNLSFWNRQSAGHRVALGSVRELFGRFRHYRNHRLARNGAPLLVIVGHSFGGMIVYSALAQALIEAATTPEAGTTRFADLVLLVNPAFEAARYLPIYDQVKDGVPLPANTEQPPVFICVTARNDWATGLAFPIGNAENLLFERWIGTQERQAMLHTMGHLDWLRTHDLAATASSPGYVLTPRDPTNGNPFWVVSAASNIVDGHNGIFLSPFLAFLASRVFEHVVYSKMIARRKAGNPTPMDSPALPPT